MNNSKKQTDLLSKTNQFRIDLFFVSYAIFLLLMMFFSPALSWLIAIMTLTIGTTFITTIPRRILGIVVVLSGSISVSSRKFSDLDSSDDFANLYYPSFLKVLEQDYSWAFSNAGTEIALPIINIIISFLFGAISPQSLMLIYSVTISLMFLGWLEFYGFKHIPENKKSLGVAVALVFFAFFWTTQLVRQMYSSILILYAISIKTNKKYLYLLLAFLFHTTAIVFYVIIKMFEKRPKITISIASVCLALFSFSFGLIEDFFRNVDTLYFLTKKFEYYKNIDFRITVVDSNIIKLFLLLLLVYLIPVSEKIKTNTAVWKYIVFFFSILFFSVIFIPLLPLRMTLLINAVLLGYLIFIRLERDYLYLLVSFALLYEIKIFYNFTLKSNDGMNLWSSYPIYNHVPLYYLGL